MPTAGAPDRSAAFDPFYHLYFCGELQGREGVNFLSAMQHRTVAEGPVVGWLFTLEGTLSLRSGLGLVALRPGQAQSYRSDYESGLSRSKRDIGWRAIAVIFHGALALRYWQYLTRRFGGEQTCGVRNEPLRAARALARAIRHATPFVEADRAHAWLATWHDFLERHYPRAEVLPRLAPRDNRIEAYAKRTVKDLAVELGISRPALSLRLRRHWGREPAGLLREHRLARAKELLRSTRLPMEHIAQQVGYRSASGFGAAFLRGTGTTPGRFRAQQTPLPAAATGGAWPAMPPSRRAAAHPLQDDVSREDWDQPLFKLSIRHSGFAPGWMPMDLTLSAVLQRPCAVFTFGGGAVFQTARRAREVQRGSVLLYQQPVQAGWYPANPDQGWQRVWVHFQGELAGGYYRFLAERYGMEFQLPVSGRAFRQLLRLAQLVKARRSLPTRAASRLVYLWLLTLHESLDALPSARCNVLIANASRHFENQPLRLNDYARLLGYSRSHIARKLKVHWGVTPGVRLRQARLELAARELRNQRSREALG